MDIQLEGELISKEREKKQVKIERGRKADKNDYFEVLGTWTSLISILYKKHIAQD